MGAPILSLFPPGDFSLIAIILGLPLMEVMGFLRQDGFLLP